MDVYKKDVRIYHDRRGKSPFNDWAYSLNELKAQTAISARLERALTGNFGDFKFLGQGVCELRIHLNPGYRIYVGLHGNCVIVLFGGIKRTQSKDIEIAGRFWREYLKHEG